MIGDIPPILFAPAAAFLFSVGAQFQNIGLARIEPRRDAALLEAPLIAVAPIVATSPIFTMLLSVLVFRRDKLTPRIVLAVFMVVPSVIFIALNR